MALVIKNLHKIAGTSGFNLWVYKTDDAAADVDTAGYFNAAANVINIGDLILRLTYTTTAFTTLSTAGFHVVNANSAGVVDLQDTLTLIGTAADTIADTD